MRRPGIRLQWRNFCMYHPLLYKESVVNGIFDEDLLQELCLLFLKCVAKFNIR